jgi:large subunit ribosomal protein L14|tara:strand:+ start:385 stop:786 length:402 start_codon:yes stop_codon:yes gene_type:complete
MKALAARMTRAIPTGSVISAADNSGARLLRVFTVVGAKTVKGRVPSAGVSDLVMASVIKGDPKMRKQVVYAVIVRQKKSYRRSTGERIMFQDNAAVVLKDDKGAPRGTIFKGPIAKEAALRWPNVGKVAKVVV